VHHGYLSSFSLLDSSANSTPFSSPSERHGVLGRKGHFGFPCFPLKGQESVAVSSTTFPVIPVVPFRVVFCCVLPSSTAGTRRLLLRSPTATSVCFTQQFFSGPGAFFIVINAPHSPSDLGSLQSFVPPASFLERERFGCQVLRPVFKSTQSWV